MINAGPSLHIKLAQAAAPSLANPPHWSHRRAGDRSTAIRYVN